ncbi:hypothetical protein BH10CYA1_BH10CYA1_02950 [soil metagenome]
MSDITAESAKPIEAADNSLKKATTNEAAREALSGLATSNDPTQRAQEVSQATNVLVHNGDLPQVLLVFDGNENLAKLALGGDQIDKNNPAELAVLKLAAETGSFVDKDGKVVTLTTDEWIAARALYQNFDAIEGTAESGSGDGLVSTGDINHAATDATAQAALGTRYSELESVVMAFPGLTDGSVDPAAFTKIFGKESVSKDDVETLLRSPQFDTLTEQQQRGVLALYSQYDNIAGKDGDASSVNPNDVWMAAGEAGINYGGNKDAMAAAQADVDAYETSLQPKPPVSGDTVDSIVRDLEKPMPAGTTVFDYLDKSDNNVDGTITREQVHSLATSDTLGLIDPKLAASIQALDQNWDQLSGGKDRISIQDLAVQSSSYKGDATTDAIKAHAAQAAEPLTAIQINNAMQTIYQPNPGSDASVFCLLTDGQDGRPEDRKGFTKEDIDRTLQAYSSVYGTDSPQFKEAQAGLGAVRNDFDKYDTDGNGSISFAELKAISGDEHTIAELQKIYGPADPNKLAGMLAAGGNYDRQISQKDLSIEDLNHAIEGLPDDSPEKATLEYVLQHYDQLKSVDGNDKHLTWNDVEIFAATGQTSGSTDSASPNSSGSPETAGSTQLKPGAQVKVGTGAGTVNDQGNITYTIGTWTPENPTETPNTLAASVLTLWGIQQPYTDDMINQTLAIISKANPDVDMQQFPSGVELTIPGQP